MGIASPAGYGVRATPGNQVVALIRLRRTPEPRGKDHGRQWRSIAYRAETIDLRRQTPEAVNFLLAPGPEAQGTPKRRGTITAGDVARKPGGIFP